MKRQRGERTCDGLCAADEGEVREAAKRLVLWRCSIGCVSQRAYARGRKAEPRLHVLGSSPLAPLEHATVFKEVEGLS